MDERKIERLTKIAKLYYEEGATQQEISQKMGVSRPMISKLLAEAREAGIVSIAIHTLKSKKQEMAESIQEAFGLKRVELVGTGDWETHGAALLHAVVALLQQRDSIKLGIGCGSTLGSLCELVEQGEHMPIKGDICPLIGGFKATFKSYHTNELVRSLSEKTDLKANYLYLPALLSSQEEKELYRESEIYRQAEYLWKNRNVALLNISSVYAAPDLATSVRFGKKLVEQKAVGRILAHYYDRLGRFIQAQQDNVVQADLDELRAIGEVVALCSNVVDIDSVIGALNTGIFTSIVMGESVAERLLAQVQSGLQK